MSFNPPNNPIDLSGGYAYVSALLQLMANPVAAKARLDEHRAAETAAKERIAEADKREAETRRLHQTAVATNIVADNRIKALDAREAELSEWANRLESSEATKGDAGMRRRESAAAALENAVARREAAVAKREAAVEKREAKIRTAIEE